MTASRHTQRGRPRGGIVAAGGAVAVLALLAGCASTSQTSGSGAGGSVFPASRAQSGADRPAVGGWIGCDTPATCDWGTDQGNAGVAGITEAVARGPVSTTTGVPRPDPGGVTRPPVGGDSPASRAYLALPAGPASVDDNADFPAYQRYRQAFASLGLPVEPLPVEGRKLIDVVDVNGNPVAGANVTVAEQGAARPVQLTTDRRGRVFYVTRQPTNAIEVQVAYQGWNEGERVEGSQESVTLRIGGVAQPTTTKPVDVVFLVDTTNSMSDELARLQVSIDEIMHEVAGLTGDVHWGMTLYRDEGDLFVTRTFDLTADRSQFEAAVQEAKAGGGGDTPEQLGAGLAEAIAAPAWRSGDVTRLVFLITDAPPHVGATRARSSYADAARSAMERQISVMAVGATGLSAQAEFVLRQLAQHTAGEFVMLTAGADGASPAGPLPREMMPTPLSSRSLDQAIVELVSARVS